MRPAPRKRRVQAAGPLGSVGVLVAEHRRQLALTQRDLADLAAVGERTVQALEAGKPTLQLDVVVRVLDALGLVVAVLPRSEGRRMSKAGHPVVEPRQGPADA